MKKSTLILASLCVLFVAGTALAGLKPPVAISSGDDYYPQVAVEEEKEGGAVSFSVNGPDDPHYDGVKAGSGNMYFMWPWTPPPVPSGLGPYPPVRLPGVPWAIGISTARPGDVTDYAMLQVASGAEIFQSEPDKSQGGTVSNVPAGTNNQILKAIALGLRPGFSRDEANVNAYSFGEDFF